MNSLAHFTNRDRQIAAFDALWNAASPWVLVFSGLSGNGKSTLIEWLIEYKCKPQNIQHIKIDMGLYNGINIPVRRHYCLWNVLARLL